MIRRIQEVQSTANLFLDCYFAECFIVQMNSPVHTALLRNSTPGKLYTFIFHQDAEGGNRFTWPPQCRRAAPIDLKPNATSTQNFIAYTGNILQAIEPGAWQP